MSTKRLSAAVLSLVVVLVASGCGGPSRPALDQAQLQERAALDAAETSETFRHAVIKLVGRFEPGGNRAHEPEPVAHFLALSGGGDFGAFGAGFLIGWGDVENPEWRRPSFDVVTGVSTGALIAPFAYLGTDEALQTIEDFYRNPKKDWVRKRSGILFLPWNPSFATIPGLERDIRAAIDREFINRMAERSRLGNVLLIGATDLDLKRQKFWDIGTVAEEAADSGDIDRLQRMLLASSAIPVVFPPVAIGDSLYGDGGITANTLLRLDIQNPDSFIAHWRREHPETPLPRIRYWIIMNNQLTNRPKTVQPVWPETLGASLSAAIKAATLEEVRWLAAQARYVNSEYGADIEVRVIAIPDDWEPPVEGDFQKETMDSLADLGRRLGADSGSWEVWASPTAIKSDPDPTDR